jgi:hypothetical protein
MRAPRLGRCGILEVLSGNGARSAQLTHYAYGTALVTKGSSSHLLELFLGDQPGDLNAPELPVRGNGSHLDYLPRINPVGRWVGVDRAGGRSAAGVQFGWASELPVPGSRSLGFRVLGVSSEGGVGLGVVAERRPAGPDLVAGVAFEA